MLRTLCLALLIPAATHATQEPYKGPHLVTLRAADGNVVHGWHHPSRGPLVLLFHQASGSAAEYTEIAFKLYAMGYSTLAIDARGAGSIFGPPIKSAPPIKDLRRDWRRTLPDLEAALAWAKTQHGGKKVIVWGSSYSAALAFVLAAKHPDRIEAVLAFSPGEYIRPAPDAIAQAAARVTVPVFIMTPTTEKGRIAPIVAALKSSPTVHVLETAVHGSSALIEKRCPAAASHWPLVEAFLKQAPPMHLRP